MGVIMAKLLLKDIMNRSGIDPKKVKLLRHALSDSTCKRFVDNDMVEEYTSIQNRDIGKGYEYFMVFISGDGTTAILDSFYKIKGSYPNTKENMPKGFRAPEAFNGKEIYYDLERSDELKDYENCLIIQWGNNTRRFDHKGTTDKEVLAIHPIKKYTFPGYEKIVLKFKELKEIIDEPALYSDWKTALSNVNGVYIITDSKDGKQYVGSAYGEDGIWGRWSDYIKTKDGGNKKLIELLNEDPKRYKSFQFSILQVLPKSIPDEEVINTEKLYKNKLLTKDFGLNDN